MLFIANIIIIIKWHRVKQTKNLNKNKPNEQK